MKEETFKCNVCEKEFSSSEALEMHNKAKHSTALTNEKPKKINYRKIRNRGILIILLGFIMGAFYLLISSSGSIDARSVTDINIGSHQNVLLHTHSKLKIIINGEEILVPANIGISQGIMRPLHTHDSSGEIHIESSSPRDFTVGEFFQVWGKTFNSECIFEYCIYDEQGELKMYVNGEENFQFEDYVMRDSDDILIEYNSF